MDNPVDTPGLTPEPEMPRTEGMTTKVVKGSIWTLAGHLAPLVFSMGTTPFVIRLLGTEKYGLFVLVGLIPTYLAFADFGMSLASTKYGAEAFGERNARKEGRIVRTAALISLSFSFPIAAVLFIFSRTIVSYFSIPENEIWNASVSLKIASVTFLITLLCNTFNTPQLARLRMDLNTKINSFSRIAGLVLMPIVIFFGGGLIGAFTVLLFAAVLNLSLHLFVSRSLLPELFERGIDREFVSPMLRFGGPLVVASVAAILLANGEKLVLARLTSVSELAYYSVAFTLITLATLFSSSMLQSLLPAFSQLLHSSRSEQLSNLYSRAFRLNLIAILPVIAVLVVIAREFFSVWAGSEFGQQSTTPFYILLAGVVFSIIVYVPHSLLLSAGRTDLVAKLYWLELLPYIGLVAFLTSTYGILGAAIAWSIRAFFDAIMITILSRAAVPEARGTLGVRTLTPIIVGVAVLAVPAALKITGAAGLVVSVVVLGIAVFSYALLGWFYLLDREETVWVTDRLRTFLG